jgi:hypothetical protein
LTWFTYPFSALFLGPIGYLSPLFSRFSLSLVDLREGIGSGKPVVS